MKKETNKNQPVPLITNFDKRSVISEQYRTIRSNIKFSSVDNELKTLLVTSAGPSEGKSTTAANLAVVFADTDMKVLLVDADLRKPTVAMSFHLPNVVGLSTFLGDRKAALTEVIHPTSTENLFIMTSGPKPPNPSEILSSKRMTETIEVLKNNFDLVIFDMPPVATVTDAQILAAKADGTLLVVREGQTKKQDLVKAKELLTLAHANIIGVVYNATTSDDEGYYYYG